MDSNFLKKKGELTTMEMTETILSKSIAYMDFFNGDVLCHNKVAPGNSFSNLNDWRRHRVSDNRGSATVSLATISPEKETHPINFSSGRMHLPELHLEDTELEEKIYENKETGLLGGENARAGTMHVRCKDSPNTDVNEQVEHVEELEKLKTYSHTENLENFDGLTINIKVEVKQKDKSMRKRFLNMVDEILATIIVGKSQRRTGPNWRRETSSVKGQRERQKRRKLICCDNLRQRIKDRVDAHWEEKRKKKEVLRLKEEERFEKWMVEHGIRVSDTPPNQPKKRMCKWE